MAKPITDTIRSIQNGAFVDAATEELRRLLLAVDESGKSGKLTLEISVAKLTRGGAVTIKDRSKLQLPNEAPAEGIFWVSPEGDPLTEDPHQQKLDLKVAAPAKATDLRTAG